MKTLLIDSNYLCYRAFYSVGNLSYNGIPTGITYGFLNQFFNIVKEISPDQIVFFWDSRKNKRKEILPSYKERNDNKTEEEKKLWNTAFKQFKKIRMNVLPKIGFYNNFLQIGYESDDTIAQYVYCAGGDENIVVATSDDDMLQIINQNCTIYNLNKNKYYDEQAVIDAWRVRPNEWGIVKCIAGCSTDNVPGVPGVKEKTAIKYLKGELKQTHKAYQEIESRRDLIKFNEQLVMLPFKGTHDFHNDLKENEFSIKNFLHVCRDYGFNSFRKSEKRSKIKSLFL